MLLHSSAFPAATICETDFMSAPMVIKCRLRSGRIFMNDKYIRMLEESIVEDNVTNSAIDHQGAVDSAQIHTR
jgi:hypothetical protein